MSISPQRILASIVVAALLAVTGLRGQTLSLGGSHVHADGLEHADHGSHHNHSQQAAPAEPHSHDEQGDHLHLTLDDWARTAPRAAVDLPKVAVFAIVPMPALPDIGGTLYGPGRALRPFEQWRPPPAGELTALRSIRLLV